MGSFLAEGLVLPVAVIDRLVEALLAADVPLDRGALEAAVAEVAAVEAPLARPEELLAAVDALVGLGPLEPLLRDPSVSDVLVNRFDDVWVERDGALAPTEVTFPDAAAVVAAVERMIAPLGLRLDRASPAVDARLPDGSRLHAIIPPVAVDGPVVAIRRFTDAVGDLDELVARGGIEPRGAELLADAVAGRRNVLVAGQTGSGKTTLLNVLARAVPADQRVVTVEDAAELAFPGHVVRLEARAKNAEGFGEVTMRTLLRHALRLRPDRIVVGEVRGAEALDMVQALGTGHRGSMSTIHASGPDTALARLEMLASSAERPVDASVLRRQIRAVVDLVVFMVRDEGVRRVRSIVEVDVDGLDEVYAC